MKTILRKLLLLFLIISCFGILRSQTVITTVGSATQCSGELIIPVNVTDFSNVGAFSMVLNVNSSSLSYTGFQNLDAALNVGTFVANEENGNIYLSWYGSATTITNGSLLVELKFMGSAGTSPITWNTQTAGSCEYTGINGQVIPSAWINGNATINHSPVVTTHPSDKLILVGNSTTFTVSATGAGLSYLWQLSTNGGASWTDLSNGGYYSNVSTATLNVSNSALSLNGSLYRCEVSGSCLPLAYSDSALLTVKNYITTSIQSATHCEGGINIPVTVADFDSVGAFSMAFIIPQNLSYLGYQNLNTGLSGGTLTSNVSGGRIYVSWYATSGVSLPNGVLFELKFTALPGTGTLTWDVQTPGNCEYSNTNGSVLYSNWVNGNIIVNQSPLITTHPTNKTITTGSNTSFSVTATGTGLSYLWQLSTDGGNYWFDLSNGGNYSNVTNPTLNISNATLGFNAYRYRCRVTGSCSPVAYSDQAVLKVNPFIITTCQTITTCPGELIVPVDVDDFIDVGAFSMALTYDSSVLTYNGYQNFNTTLTSGTYTVNETGGIIYISWYNFTAATLSSGSAIIELKYTGVAGSSALTWDTQTQGVCEYSDANGVIISSNWIDGNATVNQSPMITAHPANKTIYGGSNTSFSVSATGIGLGYQWQISTNNGSNWSNLSNGATYSGATTATLGINGATESMTNYLYRCYITGGCPPYLYSTSALLVVTQTAITTSISNITNPCSGNLNVPVNVTNCVNVGSISLALQFDPAKMSFEGYHTANSELSSGILTINESANSIFLSWASSDPADIGTATLVYLKFKANPDISTNLTWDTQTSGNCEYADINGTIIPTSYNNASISVPANVLIVDAGNNMATTPGATLQLSGSASGGVAPYNYLWTPASWLNNSSISDPLATPLSTVTYTLTVTDNNNCVSNDAMQVTVSYNLPQLTTDSISGITFSSATASGIVINDGGASVTARGVCWGIANSPTTYDPHTVDGTGVGAFTSGITGLTGNTTYYVRAYAVNSVGTSYGNQISFTTLEPPVNLAPTINTISNPAHIAEDAGMQTINLSGISDGNPELVQNISISASSSNLTIIPNPVVNYTQNDSTASLSYKPMLNAYGNATITVTVMDNGGTANGGVDTTTSSFNVVVLPVNDSPVANAGQDESATTGSTVVLDASGSYDIDANPLSYTWTAPTGIILSDPSSIHPTFTAPFSCSNKTYSFGLVVNDGIVNSPPDYVVITVPAALPEISVRPYNLTETLFTGSTSVEELIIKNEGVCNLSFTLSETATWLITQPTNGIISPEDSIIVNVHFTAENLNAGTYNSAITILSNDLVTPTVSVPVSFLVLQSLDIQVNASPASLCVGSSTQLHASASGGSGLYTYTWSSDPQGFSSSLQNPVVSPLVTTTYSVVVSDGNLTTSSAVTVSVYQAQAPTAVSNMLPTNNTYSLPLPISFSWGASVNASGYDIYIWRSGEPKPSTPTASDITQINYLFNGGALFSYGDTCKWQVISKNPCFETEGAIQTFSIKGLPELHVTGITNSQPIAGQLMTISWTVKNDGNGETPLGNTWVDRVWISTNNVDVNVGDAGDILLGQFPNLSYLIPGEHYVQTQQVQIPGNLIGDYFLFVITDAMDAYSISWPSSGTPLPYDPPPFYMAYTHGGSYVNVVNEISDNSYRHDNFFYKKITFPLPPLPDLKVTSIISLSNLFSGQSTDLTWTVKNKGNGNTNTNTWSDKVYISEDTVFNIATATSLGTLSHTAILNPDSSHTVTKSVLIPSNLFGTYYFYVQTDINNTVFEHVYENNNTTRSDSVVIFLTPPSDLVVTDINVPSTITNNDVLNVEWTVKNQGATAPTVNSWSDGVYLSDSPNYDLSNAYFLGSAAQNISLLPDSSYSVYKSLNLSQNISGSYYVYVSADYNNNVFEYLNENNNLLRSDTTININNPDLIVSNIVIPPANNNGLPFNIQWTVKNNGQGKVFQQAWKDKILASASPIYHPDSVIQIAEMSYPATTLLAGASISQTKLISLPDSLSGAYYLYVFTDWANTIYESGNENNNTLRSSGTIQLDKPDLAVSDILIPPIDSSGQAINITWKVKNLGQGTISNRNWTDRVMISYNPVYNPNSVIPIASLNYNGYLESGDSITKTMLVNLPDSIPGPYYIFIKLDCFDVIYENQSENNNVGRSVSDIQVLRPDLIAKNLVVPFSANSGETINIEWTTKNIAQVSILNKSWTDRVLLTSYQGTNTIIKDKAIIATLHPGDSLTNQLSIDIPEGIQGTYYLRIITDFNNDIEENIYENNNVVETPIQFSIGSWADLQLMNMQLPDTALAGSNVPLSFKVKNTGTKAIINKSWMDKVYISSLPVWDSSAATFVRVFEQSLSLVSDLSYDVVSNINLPSGLTDGIHYIYVYTDKENTVFEYTNENNNVRRSDSVYINSLPPVDLAVMNIVNPDSASSGQAINVQWTVKNLIALNSVSSWYDAVYLSPDSIWDRNTDIFFGKRFHHGQLGYEDSYNCVQTFYLPNGISGDYYLLVVADYEHVNNDGDLLNNYGVRTNTIQTTNIKLTPPPDLQLTAFTTPTQALTASPFKIHWTAENSGVGDIVNETWTDKAYLSTDFTINTGDLLIGSKTRTTSLGISQTYNDSLEITLPNNLSGNYIIIIKTDADNAIYESDGNNNTKYSFIYISQPPPADLSVLDVIPPASVIAGKSASIQWTVKNIGQNPASGTAKDLVYFSTDPFWDINDVLFGVYQSPINLAPGAEISRSLTAKVNDLHLGYYYAIVRTDVLNNINENNENNNITASIGTLYADVTVLPLGVSTADTLIDSENLYFRIPVADSLNDETMLTTLKADSLNGFNEMYLKHDNMPTRITYDYSSGNPYPGKKEVIVPSVIDGNYYMLLYGNTQLGNRQNIDVKAEILDFEIRTVDPSTGGNNGQVTLKIIGSKFDPLMEVSLKKGATSIIANNLMYVDYSKVFATFDLMGIQPGVFDIVIKKQNGDTISLHNGFEIVNGTLPNLGIYVNAPPSARQNRITSFTIEFANLGNTNIIDPELTVQSLTSSPIALSIDQLPDLYHELLVQLKEENGPSGILRPGVVGTITVFIKVTAGLGFVIKY